MNPSIEIVGNIICAFFILIAAYGALKQKKEILIKLLKILLFQFFIRITILLFAHLLIHTQNHKKNDTLIMINY